MRKQYDDVDPFLLLELSDAASKFFAPFREWYAFAEVGWHGLVHDVARKSDDAHRDIPESRHAVGGNSNTPFFSL